MTTVKDRGDMLRQVLLRRPSEHGYYEEVFWIDNAVAKAGKRVRDDDGLIWTIVEIYSARHFEDVDKLRAAWKRFAEVLS